MSKEIEKEIEITVEPLDLVDEVWVATDHNGGLYYIAGDHDPDAFDDYIWDIGQFYTWHKKYSNIGEPHMYPTPQSYFSALVYKAYMSNLKMLFSLLANRTTDYTIVANRSLKEYNIPDVDKASFGDCNYYLCGPMTFSNGTVRNSILAGFSTNDPEKATSKDLSELPYAIREFSMNTLKTLLDRNPDIYYRLIYLKEGDNQYSYELSDEPFSSPKSGCIGVISITKTVAFKTLTINSDDWKATLKRTFKTLLNQYNAVLTGDVYTFYHYPIMGEVSADVSKQDFYYHAGYDCDFGYTGDFSYALDSYAAQLGLEVLCTAKEYVEQQKNK